MWIDNGVQLRSLLMLLLLIITPVFNPLITYGSDFYYWLEPGVYFTYLYRFNYPIVLQINKTFYVVDELLVNITVIDVSEERISVNYSLIVVNARMCKDIPCIGGNIIEKSTNKTLSTSLDVDLISMGVLHNGTWMNEWIYMASLRQIRGDLPKFIYCPRIGLGFVTTLSSIDINKTLEEFFNVLREDVGSELVECMQKPECVGESSSSIGAGIITGEKPIVVHLSFHDAFRVCFIHPPPSDLRLVIKGFTISGDRIASSTGGIIEPSKNYSFLELEKARTIARSYIYVYKLKTHPFKLYVLEMSFGNESGVPYYVQVLYDPLTRRVYELRPCANSFYYDHYTGILLYAEFYGLDSSYPIINAYSEKLGISSMGLERVTQYENYKSNLTLIDTNIALNRPILGGEGIGFNLIYLASAVLVILAFLIILKLINKRKRVQIPPLGL